MTLIKQVPRLLKWITAVLIVFLLFMSLYRFVFYLTYHPVGKPLSGSAFLMGLRYDIKFVCMLALTMLVLCAFTFLNPFKKTKAAMFWNIFLPVIFFITIIFYAVDFFHFDYIQQRLNASVLSYLNDAAISFNTMQQSYPVFKVTLLLVIILIVFIILFKRILRHYQNQEVLIKKKKIGWYVLFVLLFAAGVFGKIGQYNLRWSDAFMLNDNFKANLALNPFQSFFSTFKFRDTRPDIKKVKEYYPMMASYMGVQHPDIEHLNFERAYSFAPDSTLHHPNVVVVICETFCMYKSSMAGNPFNTTPYFKELTQDGIFYDRCFTPSFPTARGVWATVTGIPDVLGDNNRTASRNPEVVNQQVIMNNFTGYDKFYFLGGDPTWANIKGFLDNNIDSLQMYTQENFKAAKADVWGIDDKNLFLEANGILAKQQKPFFAIIQTSNNHTPYTIPDADLREMGDIPMPEDSLLKYGFANHKQYNASRYSDFCFRKFFEAAKKEKYFDNTVFIFVGDHGIPGDATRIYPKTWTEDELTRVHVPLLFYAPKLLKPQTIHNVVSQVDIMPSVASLLKVPYQNNSMGRNLFDTTIAGGKYAFVIDHEAYTVGVVTNDYYFIKNTKTKVQKLLSVKNNDPLPQNPQMDSIKAALNKMTDAYYETSKYLLYNNKQKK